MPLITRTLPIDDMTVRTDSDGGRIVDAYISVFDTPYEIRDWDGHYYEIFRAGAFKKTAKEHKKRGFNRLKVLFNHGLDIHGWPAARFSMPIGNPEKFQEDGKGLITATRFARTELAEEVLEHVNEDRINVMSFTFKALRSNTIAAKKPKDLDQIERLEVAVKEYGPCIFAANDAAEIVGVRQLTEQLQRLNPQQLDELLHTIRQEPPTIDGAPALDDPQTPPAGDGASDLTNLQALETEVLRLKAAS